MRMAAKSAIALILIACLLFTGVSCAKQSGKQAEENGSTVKRDVDPFGTELFVQVEHTYREGDSLYLLALFPDGQTGFYRSAQAGVLPEIKDLRTGQAKRIILSEYYTDTVESMFRKSVVSGLRMFQSDTSEIAFSMTSRPATVCCFIWSNSSAVSFPGLLRIASETAILPTSWSGAELDTSSM